MSTPAPSLKPTNGLLIGGVFWNDYGYWVGGDAQEVQEGLMPLAVTGSSDANIGALVVAPAQKSGSPAALLVDASGYLEVNVKAGGSGGGSVWGPNASGAAPTEDPVLTAGWDGTDVRTILTDTGGQVMVLVENSPTVSVSGDVAVTNAGLTGLAAAIQAVGSAVPLDAVMVGGSDGTDARALLVDGSGYLKVNVEAFGATTLANVTTVGTITNAVTVVGNVAAGSAVSGDPVQVAGTDGTDVRGLKTDTLGNLSTITTMNQILAANTNVTPSSTVSSESATAGVSGLCVAVTVACTLASTSQNPDNICVRVRDTTTGIIGPWQSVGLLWGTQSSTLYFNMPVFKGDTVVIDIIAPAGSFTASKNNFSAVILGDPMPVELRPDGRGLPLSSQAAQTSVIAATGTSTLVAAPAAGFRILLGWVTLSAQSAVTGSYLFISGTLNGAAIDPFIIGGTAVNDLDLVLLEGMLFDPATALVLNVTGTAGSALAAVGYDLVPI